MRNPKLPAIASVLLLSLAATFLAPATHAQTAAPAGGTKAAAHRVWSNDDLDQLRAKGLISTFSSQSPAQTQPAPSASAVEAPSARAPRPVRFLDPEWYAEQSALLQAQLDDRQQALLQYEQTLQQAISPDHTTSGINLGEGNIGITPEAGAEVLQAGIAEIQSQMDDLADLARQNGIPPGVLRG